MKKYIRLKEDTMCAHDVHEMVNYPRSWFKPKPLLKKGTLLEVEGIWANFYGNYYRCKTTDGLYDIPTYKAEWVTDAY